MSAWIPAAPAARPRRGRQWLQIFAAGLLLWMLTVATVCITGNPNLIPTLVLLGSFLVPATFVIWAFERQDTGELTPSLIFSTFLSGGILGVLAASLLESYLLHPSAWLFAGVGLIEEAVKLAALAFLTRHLAVKSVRVGMILGAAVGFGFAAFESAGYAFTALFTVKGLSLMQLVQTEVLRGLLAPFGHGLWTAILGGALFSRSRHDHFLLTWPLATAYLGVAILHALWDSMHDIALLLTLLLTGNRYQIDLLTPGWLPRPTQNQVQLFTTLSLGGLALISAAGVGWLTALWRGHLRSPAPAPLPGWRIAVHPAAHATRTRPR
jgi:RsiW-degrading membrane proteinase PrsW (M82 family)